MTRIRLWPIAALLAAPSALAQNPPSENPSPGAAPPPPVGATPSAPTNTPPDAPPPPEYYVEPAEPRAPRASSAAAEPPLPGAPPGAGPQLIWEPPPPPEPRHVAPRTSFWLGARVGWFVPFGNLFALGETQGNFIVQRGVAWSDYASSGPMFEIDIGARISRHYNVFGLWERAELGAGDASPDLFADHGEQEGGDTDFWGAGVRASSDADDVGFLSEIAVGYRRARMKWEDGSELQLTNGVFEARIGLGADIRINESFALSPMGTFGVGLFGRVRFVDENGVSSNVLLPIDDHDGHGWFSLHVGGHFDLARRHERRGRGR